MQRVIERVSAGRHMFNIPDCIRCARREIQPSAVGDGSIRTIHDAIDAILQYNDYVDREISNVISMDIDDSEKDVMVSALQKNKIILNDIL